MPWFLPALALLLLFFSPSAYSTEFAPWFGRDKELELRSFIDYQYYRRFQNGHHALYRPSSTLRLGLNVGMTPSPLWSFDAEFMTASTRQHAYLFDYGALSARYLLLDDILGDPMSLTVGFTTRLPTKQSLQDVSLFHCGEYEWLAHVAVGKESSCEKFWTKRWWGLIGFGIANRGSPWTQLHVAWEQNWYDYSQFSIFADSIIGWGNRNVRSFGSFQGYGSIAHRTLDIGLSYTTLTDVFGTLTISYVCRVYAHNRPSGVQQLFLTMTTSLPLIWERLFK